MHGSASGSLLCSAAPLPANEALRLETLEKYALEGKLPHEGLDRLTQMAADHFNVPIALVSLVGRDRQWFKSRVGVEGSETSRDVSFCAYAILNSGVFIVPDAQLDERFAKNPLVTGPPWIRFYAGAPLEVESEIRLGSFCIIDSKPRPQGLSEREIVFLKSLSKLAVGIFDEHLSRNLFEINPAPVCVLDAETLAFLNSNSATSKLLGYSAPEMEEMKLTDIVEYGYSSAQGEAPLENFELAKEFTKQQSGPWRYITKSGSEILALATSRTINYLGRLSVMSVLTDITEITRTQENLRQALQAAEAAYEAKSEFLASMSQELRAPLTHILGMSALLRYTDITPEQQEFAEIITSSAQKLEGMVQDILDYSRSKNRRGLQVIAFSPEGLVTAATRQWSEECARKSLTLTSEICSQVPLQVSGDYAAIFEVLDRLLSNAVKFTSKGGVHLAVDTLRDSDRNLHLRFQVSDTGIGISPAFQKHLFSPLNQADLPDTRPSGGCGLGLAISKTIADQLTGTLELVPSTEQAGACFRFTVPVETV